MGVRCDRSCGLRERRWQTDTTEPPPPSSKHREESVRTNQNEGTQSSHLVTTIGAEETEWKKHFAVTNQNELRKEVVRYDMPTWRREKNWIKQKKKSCQIKREIPASCRKKNSSKKKPCTRLSLYSNFPTSWRKLTTQLLRRIRKIRREKKVNCELRLTDA